MQLDLHTGPQQDFDLTSPRRPLTLVCVDGSEESDRALRWAMRNLPSKHGLMLIHGVKIPYSASLEIHQYKVDDMREHDRLVQRYKRICQENGRSCGMAHFQYQRGDAFGDAVCSYARLRGAQAVVTGRRTNISNARRAVFGSGSQYVLQHCEDIPVTVVSTEEQSD